MRKICYFFLNISLFITCALNAQGATQQPAGGQGVGPSTIYRPPMGKPPEKIGPKPHGQTIPTQPASQPKPQFSYRPTFTQPGILSLRSGGYVGVDHLYNISANIPVVVEIAQSENLILPVSKERVQMIIEKAFEREGINPIVRPSSGPALPFFQVLVMVIPAGDGISAFCSGRLFEKVELERVALPQGVYYQAITWEYQNLIFSSKEDSEKQLVSAIAEIVEQFLSRYKYYKNIKVQ